MASAILIKSGGGGVTSEDVTAYRSQILEGKTALTRDSNDEITTGTLLSDATISNNNQMLNGVVAYGRNGTRYVGNIQSMNGGTYNPSTSAQTVSCSGKKMNSNIVINAIPSNYINTSGGSYIFNAGAWGPLVNRGVTMERYFMGTSGTAAGTSVTLRAANDGPDIINGRLQFVMASNTYQCGCYVTGSIDLTRFTKLKFRLYGSTVSASGVTVRITLVNATSKTLAMNEYRTSLSGVVTSHQYGEQTLDISGVNGQCYISLYMGYGGSGMSSVGYDYIKLE